MKKIIIVILITMLASCGNTVYDIFSRTQDNPDNFVIHVDSMSHENQINCSWLNDSACDEYILMRSKDAAPLHFTEVYRGGKLQYTDTFLSENTKYLYRLDKMRGKLKFKGTKFYLGVYNKKVQDIYEPNNISLGAVLLDTDKNANLYYYRALDGTFIEDEDWYKIELPGKWDAQVTLVYNNTNTPFIITLPDNGAEETPVSNGTVVIKNTSNETRIFRFKISVNKNVVASGSSPSVFLPYTIKIEAKLSGTT